MPPPTASGMNRLRATSRDRLRQRPPRLERRGDVQDDDLVDALDVVARRQLGRIASRAQPLELHALDDLSVADVETRDDPLRRMVRQPGSVSRRVSVGSRSGDVTSHAIAEIAEHREAGVAGLLRVELQAEDRAALDDAGERVRTGRRRRRRRLADRRRERVREVGLRPRRDAGEDRRRPRRVHGVPADVRHLELGPRVGAELTTARSHSGPSRPQRPGSSPEPRKARRLGAALEQELQSEADAEERLAGAGVGQDRLAPRRVQHRRRLEVADARHDQPVGAGDLRRRVRREHLGAGRGQRLAHRRQVAGAIVDQRDPHNSPLVLGSIVFSCLSFEQATRSARANALNTASTW